MISAAIAVSAFGFLDLTLLAQTRIYYAMGADGVFFPASRASIRASERRRRAIVLQAGVGHRAAC